MAAGVVSWAVRWAGGGDGGAPRGCLQGPRGAGEECQLELTHWVPRGTGSRGPGDWEGMWDSASAGRRLGSAAS